MEIPISYCWHQIGITGDKSCPQLKEVIHCRNCSVYSSFGRALFERQPPNGYLEEWTNLLAQSSSEKSIILPPNKSKESTTSVIIFRLEKEWFALPVNLIKEITSVVWVHTLPHRSNHILRGIVNIRGEILTCISLSNLLNLKPTKTLSKSAQPAINYPRMIVLEIQENRWVFEADELDSIHRFYLNEFQDSPTALSKNHDTYTQKIINFNEKKINYLDSELLFYELLFYTYSRTQSTSNNIETINPQP